MNMRLTKRKNSSYMKEIQDVIYNTASKYLKTLGWDMNDIADYFICDVEQTDDTNELPHSDVKDINFAASALSNSMLSSELTAIDKASKSIIEISKPAMGF